MTCLMSNASAETSLIARRPETWAEWPADTYA